MSSTSLKQQAIRGTVWTILGYGSSQVLRFGSNLILTRLLVPELFGLMALVQVFIRGLSLFSDIGIRPSIIRSDRGNDPIFLNTAWTIQVIRGFGLWVGCLIIAIPVANYYEDSRLAWLIPIVGLNTIISGFNSTSLASLNRQMEVGKIARFELGTQIIALVILIIWAWIAPSIWALVGGNLASIFIKAYWSHRLNPGKPNRFVWDKSAISEIVSFGKWIFLSTAMTFLASQADRILLGKFFSLEILGIYVIAFTFADIPRQLSLRIGSKVIFPVFSQFINLPRKQLRNKISKKRWNLLILIIFMVATLASFGDLVILALYDFRYEQAAWMLPILALGLWPILLCLTVDPCLMAIGKPIYSAIGNFLKFFYMVVFLPLGFLNLGILGAIIVI
ncbi:MAG: oligosaccharide flippase family protein, partial [Xenococcaceae cyanobacterium MO_188.B19]|nr:oligosaccharide flippase family protein [Xenococcaceae cyanobacterium MO_188.B19]